MRQKTKDKREIFLKAVDSLEESFVEPIRSNRDRAGVIQNFEFAYEATWKYLQKKLEEDGHELPVSPRKTFELAYQSKLIGDEKVWLEMMQDRNLTTHTYDEKLANQVLKRVKDQYLHLFQKVRSNEAG